MGKGEAKSKAIECARLHEFVCQIPFPNVDFVVGQRHVYIERKPVRYPGIVDSRRGNSRGKEEKLEEHTGHHGGTFPEIQSGTGSLSLPLSRSSPGLSDRPSEVVTSTFR